MKDLCFFTLSNGVEGFWANPTSGFGYICDEQPLPFFKYGEDDITPRMGGESGVNFYSEKIIPLPFGKLKKSWPIKQRLFNFSRKRTNIYWRRFFEAGCPNNRQFIFYSQLNYKMGEKSFFGQSPLINFKRNFLIKKNTVSVEDKITFKEDIEFDYFFINPLIKLKKDLREFLEINTSLIPNTKIVFKSSTGEAIYTSHKIENCKFNSGDNLKTKIKYQFL